MRPEAKVSERVAWMEGMAVRSVGGEDISDGERKEMLSVQEEDVSPRERKDGFVGDAEVLEVPTCSGLFRSLVSELSSLAGLV